MNRRLPQWTMWRPGLEEPGRDGNCQEVESDRCGPYGHGACVSAGACLSLLVPLQQCATACWFQPIVMCALTVLQARRKRLGDNDVPRGQKSISWSLFSPSTFSWAVGLNSGPLAYIVSAYISLAHE